MKWCKTRDGMWHLGELSDEKNGSVSTIGNKTYAAAYARSKMFPFASRWIEGASQDEISEAKSWVEEKIR